MSNWEKSTELLCTTSERQEKIIPLDELEQNKKAIGGRILEAFNYSSDYEIASLLKTSRKTVNFIIEGEDFPSIEILLCIYRVTGASIHWLLTGEGTKRPIQESRRTSSITKRFLPSGHGEKKPTTRRKMFFALK